MQDEIRDTSSNLIKLQANCSNRNEHIELRERVARLEPTVLDSLPVYFSSTKTVTELSSVLQSKINNIEKLTNYHNEELSHYTNKISMLEVSNTQLQGN